MRAVSPTHSAGIPSILDTAHLHGGSTGEGVQNILLPSRSNNDERIMTGKNEPLPGTRVTMETTHGTIEIELFEDMPVTAGNFASLVKKGFYDGIIFHRVINGFMIQGGDPAGTGRGGPGYTIRDEFRAGRKNDRGTLSMANAGPNTGGSQFFINLVNNHYLDGKHPVFGRVNAGMDVVDRIASVKTDRNDRPLQPVTITRATLS